MLIIARIGLVLCFVSFAPIAYGQALPAVGSGTTKHTQSRARATAKLGEVRQEPNDADRSESLFREIKELFQWTDESPSIARGGEREPNFGDLWSLDLKTNESLQLTHGQHLRSPLVIPDRVLALDSNGIRVFSQNFSLNKAIQLPFATETVRLLGYKNKRIFALRDNCVVSFAEDGTDVETKCGLFERHRSELLLFSRTCSGALVSERDKGKPVTRIDIALKPKGSPYSQILTSKRHAHWNTDPRFFSNCSKIIFVSETDVTHSVRGLAWPPRVMIGYESFKMPWRKRRTTLHDDQRAFTARPRASRAPQELG